MERLKQERYYGMQAVAELSGLGADLVRTFELEGLVSPSYMGAARVFSVAQLNWLSCLRFMMQELGLGIPGLKKLLQVAPCHEVCDCSAGQGCASRRFSKVLQGAPLVMEPRTRSIGRRQSPVEKTQMDRKVSPAYFSGARADFEPDPAMLPV